MREAIGKPPVKNSSQVSFLVSEMQEEWEKDEVDGALEKVMATLYMVYSPVLLMLLRLVFHVHFHS